MQGETTEKSMRKHMEELRLICEREIPTQQHKVDSSLSSHQKNFNSYKSEAQQTIQLQGIERKLKVELGEAEDALVKALAVKTQEEAKWMAMKESVSVTRARVEELKGIIENQKTRRDELASIVSQQSKALTVLKEKCNQTSELREQTEGAISWYSSVLGFRIECGHVLDCDPQVSDTEELVNELNKSNGLFKSVRSMREKFQETAARVSDSTDQRYKSPIEAKGLGSGESNTKSRKVNKGNLTHSPGSASSLRRSSRLKSKK